MSKFAKKYSSRNWQKLGEIADGSGEKKVKLVGLTRAEIIVLELYYWLETEVGSADTLACVGRTVPGTVEVSVTGIIILGCMTASLVVCTICTFLLAAAITWSEVYKATSFFTGTSAK